MADDVVARALVLEEPRRLVVREFPLPAVGDDDALVRVEACGLCGTDHEQYTGAVLGPGIRGLCAAAAAKEAGAGFVMVTGLGWRDAERLALASAFGADLAVDVAVDDPVAALRDATGGLADVVVDVTAKAPAAFTQAIELARTAGTVVVAGTRGWGTGAPGFEPDMVVMKELRVLGALGVDAPAYRAALDLLASERYPFADLPRRCVGLDDADDLLATMAGERDGVPPVNGVLTP